MAIQGQFSRQYMIEWGMDIVRIAQLTPIFGQVQRSTQQPGKTETADTERGTGEKRTNQSRSGVRSHD